MLQGNALPVQVNQLNSQLRSMVQSTQVIPSTDSSKPMSEVEKRKLSVHLGELQAEQLAGVIDIIKADVANLNPDDEEEVELDIDTLSNATLYKLRDYVDSIFNRQMQPARGAPDKRPPANGDAPPKSNKLDNNPTTTNNTGNRDSSSECCCFPSCVFSCSMGHVVMYQSRHAGSGSDSDSEQDSPQEVKGSTMDDPHAHSEFLPLSYHCLAHAPTHALCSSLKCYCMHK